MSALYDHGYVPVWRQGFMPRWATRTASRTAEPPRGRTDNLGHSQPDASWAMCPFNKVFLMNLHRFLACALWCCAAAQSQAMAVITLEVTAQAGVPDLVCRAKPVPIPAATPPSLPDDPLVQPDMEEVEAVRREVAVAEPESPRNPAWQQADFFRRIVDERQGLRMALWGDSHMAAAFFSQELIRLSGLAADQVYSSVIPATMNRAGVRLPVRKTCVSAGWTYDAAYRSKEAAEAPGPAMVSLVAHQPGALLQWDVRNGEGVAVNKKLRLLVHQSAQPITIGLAVDEGEEYILKLNADQGPAVVELHADKPLSTLALRLISGTLRVHGLALEPSPAVRLQFDVFAFPGATARSWQQADMGYLGQWFSNNPYQLVALAYGTNEGNQKNFDATAYEDGLVQAVRNLRTVFPQAQCLLIGPGDRGVLVRRSSLHQSKKKGKAPAKKSKAAARAAPAAPPAKRPPDRVLLQYSAIHQKINDIQTRVGDQWGCSAWSMLYAMGGQASSYIWAARKPPLMAQDLIHFTPAGYKQLADIFSKDFGWSEEVFKAGAGN